MFRNGVLGVETDANLRARASSLDQSNVVVADVPLDCVEVLALPNARGHFDLAVVSAGKLLLPAGFHRIDCGFVHDYYGAPDIGAFWPDVRSDGADGEVADVLRRDGLVGVVKRERNRLECVEAVFSKHLLGRAQLTSHASVWLD